MTAMPQVEETPHLADTQDKPVSRYGYFALSILTLVYILNYLDRQLVAVLAEPIKRDLGLSDTQLGLLTGTLFAIFYTGFGIPMAWVADRGSRTKLVAIACGMWSAFTAVTAFAANFTHVALARLGIAIAETGGVNPSYSLISDFFPPHKRGTAIAIFQFGMPLGVAGGVAYGAFMTEHFGWRSAFLWLGVPGVLLSLALPFLVKEPPRGQYDRGMSKEGASISGTFMTFARDRRLLWVTAGGTLSSLVHYIMLVWMPGFLMRIQGMGLGEMAVYYSPLIGFAVAGGGLLSGIIFDWLLKRTPRAYGLLASGSMLLAFPLFLLGISANSWQVGMPLLALTQFFTGMYVAPVLTVTVNSFPPSRRSTAAAVLLLIINLIAMGLGPLLIGGISDLARPAYGNESLLIAMYALSPFFLLAALVNYISSRIVRKD